MMRRSIRAPRSAIPKSRLAGFRTPTVFLAVWAGTALQPAAADSFDLFGIDGNFTLSGTYAYSVRLENPDNDVINAPGRPEVPIPEELKYPESNNFDDGDRNFDQWDAVNNRATLLGELELDFTDTMGIKVSGDAFYDHVYKTSNAYDDENKLNSRQQPPDTFNNAASYYNGARARLLDAYAFGTFYFGDNTSLDLKIGRHIAAWGQSLFFSGVALAQSPADATKATVPGADVKSILLPSNQISARLKLNDTFTLLGQWKLRYKPTELNPDGGFFAVADIVGPGAQFAYGIKNPLFLSTLSGFDLTDPNDLTGIADVLDQALLGAEANQGPLSDLANTLTGNPVLQPLLGTLPSLSLPDLGNLLNAPSGLNPERHDDIRADKHDTDQWGVGLEYSPTFTTTLGYYHLNYHNTNPTVRQNFGYAVLLPQQQLMGVPIPEITTESLGLKVPVSYNVEYFQNIKLDALSFSTVLFSANVGGEFIYRDGIDVLVDVDSGIAGPVPTPTRAKSYQVLLNAIKAIGPALFWDSLNIVGEVGYIYVDDVQGQPSQAGPHQGELYNDLTFDRDAAAFAALAIFNKRSVFPGWDLQVPVSVQGEVYNRSAVAGAFGSLLGENDYRLGISVNFTRLQRLTLGLTYNGFIGDANFDPRPLQDRDTLAFTAEYNFF